MTPNTKRKREPNDHSSPSQPSRKRQSYAPTSSEHELCFRNSPNSTNDVSDDTIVLGNVKEITGAKPPTALKQQLPSFDSAAETRASPSAEGPATGAGTSRKDVENSSVKPSFSPKRRKTSKVPDSDDQDFAPSSPPSPGKVRAIKTRLKVKTPPPVDPLFWADHEITGDIKDDPDDDGEGLNGVGFELPPQRAYAVRKERRKKIVEWNNLIAKEARMERSKRRSIFGGDAACDVGVTLEHGAGDTVRPTKKAVRFREEDTCDEHANDNNTDDTHTDPGDVKAVTLALT